MDIKRFPGIDIYVKQDIPCLHVYEPNVESLEKALEYISKQYDQTSVNAIVRMQNPRMFDIVDCLSSYRFSDPIIRVVETPCLFLSKKNTLFNHPIEQPIVKGIVYSLLANYSKLRSKQSCVYTFRLSTQLVKTFERMVMDAKVNKKQKEFTGHLHVAKIEYVDKMPVFVLDLSEQHVVIGDNEEVDGSNEPITFHTHPREAYEKYKMKVAWPSQIDYITIYELIVRLKGICHILATLEGIYIVSLKAPVLENIQPFQEKEEDEIEKLAIHTSYPREERPKLSLTPLEYAIGVRNDTTTPFSVDFLEWEDGTNPFRIHTQSVDGMYCKRF
jgi:hypothetical protein